MRDDPRGRFNSGTVCPGENCGLVAGHSVPCRREQEDGEYFAIDENGETGDATKGSGPGSYKIVKRRQLTHGRAQAGRLAL